MQRIKYLLLIFLAGTFLVSCDQSGGNGDSSPLDTVKSGKEDVLESLLQFDNEEALKKKFGAQRITRDTTYDYSILDAGTTSEVQFWWSDKKECSGLWIVSIVARSKNDTTPFDYRNKWRTLNGIRLGMTSGELEKMNGKPFAHNGFCLSLFSTLFGGCPSAGYISDWKGGKLGNCKWLAVDLYADGPAAAALSEDEEKQVEDSVNKTIMSNHPVVQKLQPRVRNISLFKVDYHQ